MSGVVAGRAFLFPRVPGRDGISKWEETSKGSVPPGVFLNKTGPPTDLCETPRGRPARRRAARPRRARTHTHDKTTLTLTRHLGPGALFTRARDVQTGLPGESEWRGSLTHDMHMHMLHVVACARHDNMHMCMHMHMCMCMDARARAESGRSASRAANPTPGLVLAPSGSPPLRTPRGPLRSGTSPLVLLASRARIRTLGVGHTGHIRDQRLM